MWRDFKYLIAYTAPLAAFAGIYLGGWYAPGSIYVGFVLIPLLELVFRGHTDNLPDEEEPQQATRHLFDWLLYANVPIFYGLLAYAFHTLAHQPLTMGELVGMVFNVGLIAGTIGINVAHELGHRATHHERLLSKLLLLPALYMHFYIEHNRGHHKHVATDADPASSRLGESLYAFWWRSVSGGWRNAWRLEGTRLQKLGLPFWSRQNEMLRFQILQVAYLTTVTIFFGWAVAAFAVAVAVVGFLLLECVNYVEHYGLRRRRLPTGRYEPVGPQHSWNSNHELGRIFLYELTRHSDHHYKASRKYQILRHHDESPQLPYGYPVSILLSLVPPIWFAMMDTRVADIQRQTAAQEAAS